MKIAAIQAEIAWEDPEENFRRLTPQLSAARAGGAGLIVLPEMFSTGFSMNTEAIAEPEDGPSTRFLRTQAETLGCWVAGSIATLPPGDGMPTNTLWFMGPDGTSHRYDKIHPFSYAGEHERYAAGRDRITIELGGLRITPFVCYDLRFADEFWEMAPETDCYVVVANWPAKRSAHWAALLRARAIENLAWVVGVNRVGDGGGLHYDGHSAILSPTGETICEATRQPATLLADVDPATVEATRQRFPFLQDRRARGPS